MKNVLTFLFIIAEVLSAGQNSSAKLYIDADISSKEIDSVKYCAKDSSLTVGIFAADITELYSYQMYLQYDTAQLQFISASAGSDNFLGSKGGSPMFFPVKRNKADSTQLLIAETLVGDDSSQCATGSGIIGVIQFKMKGNDTATLSLHGPKLCDFNLKVDTSIQTHSAKVVPGIPRILYKKTVNKLNQTISINNKRVEIQFPDEFQSGIKIIDIKGCVVADQLTMQKRIVLDLSNYHSGLYVLMIARNGAHNACPFFIN
jgi:hypothetical protein